MEEWVKQNGYIVGNALLSGMGLVFAIGAPIKIKLKTAKKWWILMWASMFIFYFLSASFSIFRVSSLILTIIVAIFNGVSTSSIVMLFIYLRDKGKSNIYYTALVFILSLLLSSSGTFLFNSNYIPAKVISIFISHFLAWIFFVMLAWNYRKKHMATTLLLLAYANLQLPAGLIGKTGLGVDLVLLLVSKLSLIGAMYYTLGVRDVKS